MRSACRARCSGWMKSSDFMPISCLGEVAPSMRAAAELAYSMTPFDWMTTPLGASSTSVR